MSDIAKRECYVVVYESMGYIVKLGRLIQCECIM